MATRVDPRRFAERIPRWIRESGPEGDVVVSSRVRLARNVANMPFVARLDAERATELCERLGGALRSEPLAAVLGAGVRWIEIAKASTVLRLLLRERHLVSRELAPTGEERPVQPGRAVAFDEGEGTSIMVNEEDHLRIQTLEPGFNLAGALERAQTLDRALEKELEYAYHERYGYLTCCPTNVGTGLRASVMLHLPALMMVRSELEKVFTAAQKTGLAVRGLYGEGSRAAGDLYQISNQVTLGRSEDQLVHELSEMVPAIVRFERRMREELLRGQRESLVDRISRSYGMLRTARAMQTDGALAHLSCLRLGRALGLWEGGAVDLLGPVRVQIQKGHVQVLSGEGQVEELVEPSARDRLRAAFLRKLLGRPA